MNTSNPIFEKAKKILLPMAEEHKPEGTELEAVIDQWLHALATNSACFCNSTNIKPDSLKEKILKELAKIEGLRNQEELYDNVFGDLNLKPKLNPKFRFIDLFAGIGGTRLGFQNNGGACVFSSEFDKHAQATYKNNHGEQPFGDITLIDESHIPDHDVLLAGFPCQPFSHAGLKLGIEDTRGTLFHDIARIIEAKRPRFALLENVKGLVSHEKGNTLKVILKTLTQIGYSCNIPKDVIENGTTKQVQELAKKMVLKSVDFGIPQNRQRIYIVLWRDGEFDSFKYPQPIGQQTFVKDILEDNPDEKLTISDRLWAGHQRRKVENKKKGKGFGYGLVTPESSYTNTISARYYKDGSEVLIGQGVKNPRKLSPREAARLQGFPEEFEPSSSNTQAYKQFGNTVTVTVVDAIAKNISDLIN